MSRKFSAYTTAINQGLEKLRKYYNKFDEKPVYVLALGKSSVRSFVRLTCLNAN